MAGRSGHHVGAMAAVPRSAPDTVVVCLPDIPERVHMGELPANVDLRLAPPEPEPIPDLAEVELIVPSAPTRDSLLELLAGPPGRLRQQADSTCR